MGRLRALVIALCLLLPACAGAQSSATAAACDYADFIRLRGVTYYVADHGVGRAVGARDLGPVFDRTRSNPPSSGVRCLDYQVRDGDAALAPGSPVYRVKGYSPSFRLAARHHGRVWLYEAEEAAGARVGADLLDLAGKVRYLSVNSRRFELARIKDRPRVAELVGQVLAAPVRPSSGRAEQRYCFVVFNLADGTAVRRILFPATGELGPGLFVAPAFTGAVEGALEARQRTCGRNP
ncbi:MAG TPA: hypothetical protein VH016_14300 [Actinomycetota bacterium]|nr:hypothetical protein [Actinomycetota bacterium]